MAKVFGMHTITLRPDVKEADFERYIIEEYLPSTPRFSGWKPRLLKGDRGEHAGQYILLFEIDGVEARDRYFPAEGQMSEEAQAITRGYTSEVQAVFNKLNTFTASENDIHTDYVEVTGGVGS